MWQFIISGYVPGTDIQITFEMFVTFVAAFFSAFLFWLIVRQISILHAKHLEVLTPQQDWNEIAL